MPRKERLSFGLEAGGTRVQEVIPVKRKTPYSLVDVNRLCVETIVAARDGQACIVGVDVAKGELVACPYWPDRSFDRPWRAQSPGQVRLLVRTLRGVSSHCPRVV